MPLLRPARTVDAYVISSPQAVISNMPCALLLTAKASEAGRIFDSCQLHSSANSHWHVARGSPQATGTWLTPSWERDACQQFQVPVHVVQPQHCHSVFITATTTYVVSADHWAQHGTEATHHTTQAGNVAGQPAQHNAFSSNRLHLRSVPKSTYLLLHQHICCVL
jgi:hypothetical protein